jgi:hypothetical protein
MTKEVKKKKAVKKESAQFLHLLGRVKKLESSNNEINERIDRIVNTHERSKSLKGL